MPWTMNNGDKTGEKFPIIKRELLPPRAEQRVQFVEAGVQVIKACTQVQDKVIMPRNQQRIDKVTAPLFKPSRDASTNTANNAELQYTVNAEGIDETYNADTNKVVNQNVTSVDELSIRRDAVERARLGASNDK